MLNYVRPVFFLGILLEHLTYAFLPQFVQGAVLDAGVSTGFASAPFVGFYLLLRTHPGACRLCRPAHWTESR